MVQADSPTKKPGDFLIGHVTVREVGLGSRQSHGPTLRGQQVGHELHPVLPGRGGGHGMPWAMAAHGKRWENHGKTIRKTRREKLGMKLMKLVKMRKNENAFETFRGIG